MKYQLFTKKMAEAYEKALRDKTTKGRETQTQQLFSILKDYYISPENESFYKSLKNQIKNRKRADCISHYKGEIAMSWYQEGPYLLGCSQNQSIFYIPCSRLKKILAQVEEAN